MRESDIYSERFSGEMGGINSDHGDGYMDSYNGPPVPPIQYQQPNMAYNTTQNSLHSNYRQM